jgi:spore maturation protein CgeB
MRVGIIGPTGPDQFADNIAHCLPNIGVQAVPLGPSTPWPRNKALRLATQLAARQTAETLEWFQRPLVGRVRDSGCDVIINVEQSLMPATVAKIKSGGPRIALWYPDHVANISRMAMIASDYDALFIKDPLFVQRLEQVYGLPAVYMPEACNPQWHRPVGQPGQEPFIVVVGNLYPTRARLLHRLHEAGIPLKLYGGGFPRGYDAGPLAALFTHSIVTREDKSRVFREARGVLNNLHPAEMNSVNARLFEATAAGAAVLCEHRDALEDLFRVNEEVLAFSSFEELVDHCRLLLNNPDLTRTIGDAASARAHAEHTYEIRLTAILERLA